MLTSLVSLALVLALLGGLLWWLRRLTPRAGAGRYIRIVESVPLSAGQALHLVRLGARSLLLASSRDRCELLSELDTPPHEEALDPAPSWREALRGAWGRK